ncbi:MAG: VIT1/CCC1 transporter family protein, partial [Nitrospirota bacterium]
RGAMREPSSPQRTIGRQLILDELLDLSLYNSLREFAGPLLQPMLAELVSVEERHYAFWQKFFGIEIKSLDLPRRIKLRIIRAACRLFGERAIHLTLEAIEIYGIRKYLSLWERYQDQPIGEGVRGILRDEFQHEDTIVSRLTERAINPDRIRNIFLGLNDGMVEILGAVSGFFAAFGHSATVLIAGVTTAVAGALSMAAGAYAATSSEHEMRRTQARKHRFLGAPAGPGATGESPLTAAAIIGASYVVGALFPIVPVLFGAANAVASILAGGVMILLVSAVLAFLSGMEIRKRALMNLVIIAAAVGVTYGIGLLVRSLWGIAL